MAELLLAEKIQKPPPSANDTAMVRRSLLDGTASQLWSGASSGSTFVGTNELDSDRVFTQWT